MPWLVVVSDKAALHWILAKEKMGFRAHVPVGAVRAGDRFGLYVSRSAHRNPGRDEAQIVALGRFADAIGDEPVEVAGELYPWSVGLVIDTRFEPRQGLPFRSLVGRLELVPTTRGWGPRLRRTLVPLSDRDFRAIEQSVAAHSRARQASARPRTSKGRRN